MIPVWKYENGKEDLSRCVFTDGGVLVVGNGGGDDGCGSGASAGGVGAGAFGWCRWASKNGLVAVRTVDSTVVSIKRLSSGKMDERRER